jgi:hypothetical protein
LLGARHERVVALIDYPLLGFCCVWPMAGSVQ